MQTEIAQQKSLPAPNPFCTRFIQPQAALYKFANTNTSESQTPARLVAAIIRARFAAIVGPHGTGKSTLLHTLNHALAQHFDRIEFVRLNTMRNDQSAHTNLLTLGQRWLQNRRANRRNASTARLALENLSHQFDGNRRHTLLIVDGIEQLSASTRYRLVRYAQKHGNSILATSHTDLSWFQTIYHSYVSPELIVQLADNLLKNSSPEIKTAVRDELHRRDLSKVLNIRELWFDLYDRVQDLKASASGADANFTHHKS